MVFDRTAPRTVHPRNASLAKCMAAAGLNGRQLAALASVTPVTISRILHLRQSPTAETATRIAAALDVTVDELFGVMPNSHELSAGGAR